MGMTFLDWTDLSILHAVDDVQQEHGEGRPTEHFAQMLEIPKRNVGSRFAQMRARGLLNKDTRGGWIVGRAGRSLLNGRGQDLEAVSALAERMARNETASWVMLRQVKKDLGARR